MIDHSLKKTVEHIDISKFNVTDMVDQMESTSFTSREIYNACQLYKQMLQDIQHHENVKQDNKQLDVYNYIET